MDTSLYFSPLVGGVNYQVRGLVFSTSSSVVSGTSEAISKRRGTEQCRAARKKKMSLSIQVKLTKGIQKNILRLACIEMFFPLLQKGRWYCKSKQHRHLEIRAPQCWTTHHCADKPSESFKQPDTWRKQNIIFLLSSFCAPLQRAAVWDGRMITPCHGTRLLTGHF